MEHALVKRFSGEFLSVTITGKFGSFPWIYTGTLEKESIVFTWNPATYCYEEIESAGVE